VAGPGPSFGLDAPDRGLQPYIRAIRARASVVRAITITVLAVALLLATQREPSYEASAKLLAKPIPATDTSLLALDLLRDSGEPTRTMQTAAALVDTQSAARRAARKLGKGWTADSVREATDVKVQGESNVIEVRGRTHDADSAAAVANAFASSALDLRREALARNLTTAIQQTEQQLQRPDLPGGAAVTGLSERLAILQGLRDRDDPTLVLAEPAFPPASATGVPRWLIVALSGIAGFVLAVGAALLLETVDLRTRDEDDVLNSFPAPVLTVVPPLSRREMREVEHSPLQLPHSVRESYRTLLVQLDQAPVSKNIIMLGSASPGDGKTTAALHLALLVVEHGRSAIVIDFDLRHADLTSRLLSSAPPVTNLMEADPLSDVLVPVSPGLLVLPAPSDITPPAADAMLSRAPALFEQAAGLADYVIVDTPALGEVSDALRIAPSAGQIVMVARPGHTNKRQLELAHELLIRVGAAPKGLLMIGPTPPGQYHYQ
jgi:Mrp family chromosome partitioning ATPase